MTISQPDSYLSTTDHVVMALLGEHPAHGFAVAKSLEPDADLGRILTVRRSVVYRSIGRLAERGLIVALATQESSAGPQRTVFELTEAGQAVMNAWLSEPVEHIRQLRIDFLVKLRLIERSGGDPQPFVERQRRKLAPAFEALGEGYGGDVVDTWRHYSARAARDFLSFVGSR